MPMPKECQDEIVEMIPTSTVVSKYRKISDHFKFQWWFLFLRVSPWHAPQHHFGLSSLFGTPHNGGWSSPHLWSYLRASPTHWKPHNSHHILREEGSCISHLIFWEGIFGLTHSKPRQPQVLERFKARYVLFELPVNELQEEKNITFTLRI